MKQEYRNTFTQLDSLRDDSEKELKQKRGLDFEALINQIMADEKILLRKSYHTDDNKAEQIDGAIEVYNRIFLMEVKWVTSDLAASELYAFIGKIENKFHGTLGLFISRNPLSGNFINALNKGRRQSVIVIHGSDLDEIFSGEFLFKEYLTEVFKVLSYDNLVHYPVNDFKERAVAIPVAPAANTNVHAVAFIQQKLLNGTLDRDQLAAELGLGDKAVFDVVFSYVVNNFYKTLQNSRKNHEYTKYYNLVAFLETYHPDAELLKAEAQKYYQVLLPEHFEEYSWELFIEIFSHYYNALPDDVKRTFEQFSTKKFGEIFGNYDAENQLTVVLKPIWKYLDQPTRDMLSKFYLNIFVTDRLDKFPQKTFARELLSSGQLTSGLIEEWLREKLQLAKTSFDEPISTDNIRFIARTYWPVGAYLKYSLLDWLEHIRQILAEE